MGGQGPCPTGSGQERSPGHPGTRPAARAVEQEACPSTQSSPTPPLWNEGTGLCGPALEEGGRGRLEVRLRTAYVATHGGGLDPSSGASSCVTLDKSPCLSRPQFHL